MRPGKRKGYLPKYKHGKNTEPITFDYFKKCMNEAQFPNFSRIRNLSFLAILYYSGGGVSQLLVLKRENFRIEGESLYLDLKARKKGLSPTPKIALSLPYMKSVRDQLRRTQRGQKVWTFTRQAARNLVKQVFGDRYYPHFFRLNRATHFLDDPTTTVPEMKSWFGWKSIETIGSYVGYSKRHVDRQGERLKATA